MIASMLVVQYVVSAVMMLFANVGKAQPAAPVAQRESTHR
jgi:uncharacterized protein YgfB (UPF0149 family)